MRKTFKVIIVTGKKNRLDQVRVGTNNNIENEMSGGTGKERRAVAKGEEGGVGGEKGKKEKESKKQPRN